MSIAKTWISLGTIASPATGTLFTKILTQYNHKYILWYSAETMLKPGDRIKVSNAGLFVNEDLCEVHILQIDKYSPTLWRVMHNMSSCPGHKDPDSVFCKTTARCIFKSCPFGKLRVHHKH